MNQTVNSTTVVINQPTVQYQKLLVGTRSGTRDWTTGLFGCFEDCGSLIKACCCLQCMVYELSSRLGDCACMPCYVTGAIIAMRTRTRTLGDIHGSIFTDFLATYCCYSCSVCQMDRELKAMGL
ncbi:hypothetical protein ACJMK2_028019 [Sinanodonta woodiana]|uniref:Uncharacterized protein n=1 Tax=Sinanodonta woodiana TaxID=1069815 RepID=A0ABD3X5T7_SINWO